MRSAAVAIGGLALAVLVVGALYLTPSNSEAMRLDRSEVCPLKAEREGCTGFVGCGDGRVLNEECDDGNLDSGDGCSESCVLEFCGDGINNNSGTEECDDGNTDDDDACGNDCLLPVCGDGEPEGTEQCDEGDAINGSPSSCCTDTCEFVGVGADCGDGATECSAQDTCDGAGICLTNHLPGSATCGDAGTQCTVQDLCDGNGGCMDNGFVGDGMPCGDGETECSAQDTCNGAGTCQANDHAPTETCGDAGTDCTVQDLCDGNGACTDNGFVDDGMPCGDGATQCSEQDTCNGAGICQANHLAETEPCGDAGTQCVIQDLCDGAGACSDSGFETDGTNCNDANPDTVFDQCSTGVCDGQPNTCPVFNQDEIREIVQSCQDRGAEIFCDASVQPVCVPELGIPWFSNVRIFCDVPESTVVCGAEAGPFGIIQVGARHETDAGSMDCTPLDTAEWYRSRAFVYSETTCVDTPGPVGPSFSEIQACYDLVRTETRIPGVCADGEAPCVAPGVPCMVAADCCSGSCDTANFLCQ